MKHIEITVNGFTEQVRDQATIAELIEKFEERDKHLVVEHNGRCVIPSRWRTTTVSEGDKVEFVNPMFGG